MADLKFEPKHNIVGFLNEECPEAAGFEIMSNFCEEPNMFMLYVQS